MKKYLILIFLSGLAVNLLAQQDQTQYQWPDPPFNTSKTLNATFCEFRNTGSADHFHNAVDIGEPDGNPVYACLDGTVSWIGESGINSYVSIRSKVNNKWKQITYLHIEPNPNLSLNDSVFAGQSVMGSIYIGQGHVHFIERELVRSASAIGQEINPVRPDGGLNPYYDNKSPVIHINSLEFRDRYTGKRVPKDRLNGELKIMVKVEERNGSSSIGNNNGTYMLGYRIWSADTSEIVFEPADQGLKYKFWRQPKNSEVHNVFVKGTATLSNPVYWLTGGNGASSINENLTVNPHYFNTDNIEEDDYVLEVFTEDTRENTDQKFIDISISKMPPELLYVRNAGENKELELNWSEFVSPSIAGYRIYYSNDKNLEDWHLAADEDSLPADSTSVYFDSPEEFIEPSSQPAKYFYITAVDTSGSESKRSDIYSRFAPGSSSEYKEILIVDGFDKSTGSEGWQEPNHYFNTSYFNSILANDTMRVSSAYDAAVRKELIDLNDYDMVFWFVGDNSREESTLIGSEQGKVAFYLEDGGTVFMSGSEIGYDLDIIGHEGSDYSDTLFYRHFLKSTLVHTGASVLTNSFGIEETPFEGLSFDFGSVYEDNEPDDIEPVYGGQTMINYDYKRSGDTTQYRKCAVAFTGKFRESDEIGKMFYLSLGFENIGSEAQRNSLMDRVLKYFGTVTDIKEEDKDKNVPGSYALSNNYPNPFNPVTHFNVTLPQREKLTIKVFDVLGREVTRIFSGIKAAGSHKFSWNAVNSSSSVYFIKMNAGEFSKTINVMLVK